jgi:hypothetical protein
LKMADNLASDLEIGRAAFLKFLADGPKRCPKLYASMGMVGSAPEAQGPSNEEDESENWWDK